MALAGGVSIGGGIHGKIGYLSQDEGILSPDGHCRAFDAQAQGTIWADGVGLVVLKRVNVTFRCFLDEISIENLPAVLLVLQPLGANLVPVVQPICDHAGKRTHGCAGHRG